MEDFDAMAKDFDIERRIQRASKIAKELRKHIADGHQKSALEYGCGTGLVGLRLIDDFKTILFVDSSAEMIARVEKKLESLHRAGLSALCSDLSGQAPEGLRVDYIFSSLVLHHIRDTEAALGSFHRMLNDGGHLLIVDLDEEDGSFHAMYPDFEGHNGFNHEALAALVRKAGFSAASIKTFYQDSKSVLGKGTPYSLFLLNAVK